MPGNGDVKYALAMKPSPPIGARDRDVHEPLAGAIRARADRDHADRGGDVGQRRDHADREVAEAREASHDLRDPQREAVAAGLAREQDQAEQPHGRMHERGAETDAVARVRGAAARWRCAP